MLKLCDQPREAGWLVGWCFRNPSQSRSRQMHVAIDCSGWIGNVAICILSGNRCGSEDVLDEKDGSENLWPGDLGSFGGDLLAFVSVCLN
jgi:hypothetical protein